MAVSKASTASFGCPLVSAEVALRRESTSGQGIGLGLRTSTKATAKRM
jgi:hypothetical protein